MRTRSPLAALLALAITCSAAYAADDPVIVVEPEAVEFGEIPTGKTSSAVITVTNNGDTPRKLIGVRASCGCTAVDVPENATIEPGGSIELPIDLKAAHRPTALNKTVTILVEGNEPIVVRVVAEAVSFVTLEPETLDPRADAEVVLKFASRDDAPFRILEMQPRIMEFDEAAKATHEIRMDWARWEELGKRQILVFVLDHPECERLFATVRVSARERARRAPDPALANLERRIQADDVDAVIEGVTKGEIDPESTDRMHNSVLALAAKHGHVPLMRALLDVGADIESIGQMGRTPLSFAAQSKSAEAVQLLLDEGADVASTDDIGGTPLGWAAGIGDFESVRLLVENGSDIEARNNITGFTPVIWAALSGSADSVKLLLDKGADASVKDNFGKTALEHARGLPGELGAAVIELLEAAGADD